MKIRHPIALSIAAAGAIVAAASAAVAWRRRNPPPMTLKVTMPAVSVSGSQVDGLLLAAIKGGTFEPIVWSKVESPDLDLRFWVAADAVRAPVDGKMLRLGITYKDTVEALQSLGGGLYMPATKRMVDAMYKSAPIHTVFHSLVTADPDSGGIKVRSIDYARRYNADVDKQIADKGGEPGKSFAMGHDKFWILHPRLAEFIKDTGQPTAVNYGAFDAAGRPQQGVGGRHDILFLDESQNLRPVKRWGERLSDGMKVDLLEWAERNEGVPARFTEPFRGTA